MTELYSASKCQQFCPADRKEEKRLLGTREAREKEEKADTQKWETTKIGGWGWKRGRAVSVLLQRVGFNIEFHRRTTHSLNVF